MTSLSIDSSERLLEQVLRYVPVRDLFSCSQVNAIWKRISLALLRNKLKWVLCTAPLEDDDDAGCSQTYCSQMGQFCRIARMAGKRATLHFLLIAEHFEERMVLNGARKALPQDCLTLLFKSKMDRTLNFEGSCKGMNGLLVFDTIVKNTRSRRRNRRSSKGSSRGSVVSSLSGVSKLLRRWVLGDSLSELPVCFKNTSPGVLTFQSTINVPSEDGGHITYSYIEQTTGHKLQVSTTCLHAGMKYQSLECILSLRVSSKDAGNAIMMVLQPEPVDVFVMEYIYCLFRDVPVISICGKVEGEVPSNASEGSYTSPGLGGITVMLFNLLPAYSEKKSKKKKKKKKKKHENGSRASV